MYKIPNGDIDFAKKLASKMHRRYGSAKMEREELESLALLGLVEASNRYCHGKGATFRSFAYSRIMGQMLDHLRNITRENKYSFYIEEEESSSVRQVQNRTIANELLGMRTSKMGSKTECSYLNDKTPEEICNTRLLLRKVEQVLRGMSEVEQSIIRLHYFEDRLFCDIKGLLGGKSKSYISSCHSRAIDKLSAVMVA